ncbi:MAG: phosphopantothenoylcysteine decarboxylase [Gemmataceae bacterium]
MNILVTAGNTLAMVDRVRCLTNIFSGRTGASIAREAVARQHQVMILTSHPETILDGPGSGACAVQPYKTFEDLQGLLTAVVPTRRFDAIIHCAAVSDYLSVGVYAPESGSGFDPTTGEWNGAPPRMVDRSAGKVRSDAPELWIRLQRAPKLIDRMRTDWGFNGLLVKFKLEVGLTDEQLLEVAERSRLQSQAELMVANTLEGATEYALMGEGASGYRRVTRNDLPGSLLDQLEVLHRERLAGG